MRRIRRAGMVMQWTATAAVSAVSWGLVAVPTAAIAQSAGRAVGRPGASAPSGFARTVQHLMEQARKEAAAGNYDAAVQTALRARKIAEAASTTLGASPDCSPEAAEALYRELLAQRPAASISPAVSTAVPVPKSPVVTSPLRAAAADTERWRAPAPRLKTAPRLDSDATRSERPAGKPVVLKRAFVTEAPVATELGLRASLEIVGGDAARSEPASRQAIPFEEPAVAMVTQEMPVATPTATSQSPGVETVAEPVSPATAAPTLPPQPRRMDVSEWSSVGAVVPRQRLARVENLRTDGWQSSADQPVTVTRAGGVEDHTDAAAETVSPTAYHRKPDAAASVDDIVPVVAKEVLAVPAPPMELDEVDVALRAPSVWVRDSTPQVAPALPDQKEPATVWQSFSQWTKQRGWTATSATLAFAAAVLALMAFALALTPRRTPRS